MVRLVLEYLHQLQQIQFELFIAEFVQTLHCVLSYFGVAIFGIEQLKFHRLVHRLYSKYGHIKYLQRIEGIECGPDIEQRIHFFEHCPVRPINAQQQLVQQLRNFFQNGVAIVPQQLFVARLRRPQRVCMVVSIIASNE